jgi:hypothetical protein
VAVAELREVSPSFAVKISPEARDTIENELVRFQY